MSHEFIVKNLMDQIFIRDLLPKHNEIEVFRSECLQTRKKCIKGVNQSWIMEIKALPMGVKPRLSPEYMFDGINECHYLNEIDIKSFRMDQTRMYCIRSGQ